MSSNKETALWAWLLFDAGIKTYRAKQILSLLQEKELTLEELIQLPSGQLLTVGFDPYKGVLSRTPTVRPCVSAIRWNESPYPQGLHELTIKYKPALLFFTGSLNLLKRSIIYLEPGKISPKAEDILPGIVDLLLDGSILPAVFTRSPQEEILIKQMAYSEGEALIFVDQGLDQWTPSEEILDHIQAGRIVALSPMPPNAKANPTLTPIIQRIAAASANRWVISAPHYNRLQNAGFNRPALLLEPNRTPASQQLPDSENAVDISDAIDWLNNASILPTQQTTVKKEKTLSERLPPQSSKQALHILERGGKVPEALRQRLLRK